MKVSIHKAGFESTTIEDAKLIVVYDDFDNPMYVANQIDENNCMHEKAGSKGFEETLKAFGVRLKVPYRVVKA
jgi:hypothetical protein